MQNLPSCLPLSPLPLPWLGHDKEAIKGPSFESRLAATETAEITETPSVRLQLLTGDFPRLTF